MKEFLLNLDEESWQAFLKQIMRPNTYHESCAWLFCNSVPFCSDCQVYVFPVKNIGIKGRGPDDSFAPDKKDFQRVKNIAKQKKLTRIGNVHTHTFTAHMLLQRYTGIEDFDHLIDVRLPSRTDLAYARRFNDIIRGIVTVFFPADDVEGQIAATVWHDQFGRVLSDEIFIPDYTRLL